ncbi:MAG: PDZ domain-containing protein, partial [Planctomycetota bacterium JB042]
APPKPGLLPDAWMQQLEWRSIGPATMSGRIVALAVVESDPTTWWAATASGGLLKTTNDGRTFVHQFDREATVSIGDVQVAPSDPNVVWVGTGESNPRNSVSYGNGVHKSTDGGETWTHMGLDRTFQTGRIAIHPEDPNVVYVGALGRLYGPNEERGLYKTTDGGETWKKVLSVDEKTGVGDVAMRPGAPDTLIVATYERQRDEFDTNDPAKRWGPGSALWRTEDGGASWTKLVDGLPSCDLGRIDVDYWRGDPDVVFAIVESSKIGKEPDDAPYVGVRGEDADVGARLTEVTEDGPAARAGLEVGDIVVAVEDETVQSYADFIAKVRRHLAGETVLVEVSRRRKSETMEVTFSRRPEAQEDAEEGRRERRRGGARRDEGEERAPFRTSLGGQVANVHEQQGPDGHEYGGVYRSDDGGTTWRRINSINPRPMYFSLLRVDPSDDRRLVVGGIALHRSNDGGETFTDDGHDRDVHVDHHALWIDPNDGRHMILGNDGGVYVTRDRMETWDHLNHVAIGQFYHVTVGPRRDYMVYGGLQDNGTWGGPNRGPTGAGPVNEDWISVGGGDGFQVRVDPRDPDQVYFESQNGGLGRVHFGTGERGFMRPRPPRGERYRFNWQTPFLLSAHNSGVYYTAGNHVFRSWFRGDGLEAISPEISRTDRGSATALAESSLDADVLFVGTDDGALWRTKDGGRSWDDLFAVEAPKRRAPADPAAERDPDDPVTGRWITKAPEEDDAARSGRRRPGGRRGGRGGMMGAETVVDLRLAEEGRVTMTMDSPMGELEAEGTFDAESGALELAAEMGNTRMTIAATIEGDTLKGELDFGGRFRRPFEAAREGSEGAAEAVVGEPIAALVEKRMGIASLEASRFEEGRVYLAIDGHRSDDDLPHAFVSENHGTTWTSLTTNLPPSAGSSRVLREDLFNPDVLYLGCEFGLWISVDRGETWTSMKSNLPTVAVHEVAQHPTAGEIVAGTHGRSLWILDVTPLRQVTRETLAADAHLYEPNAVVYFDTKPRRGGTIRRFEGTNKPTRAELFYSLARDAGRVELEVRAPDGEVLAELEDEPTEAGLHRLTWDLRRSPTGDGEGRRRFRRGPRVAPGTYTVALTVGNRTLTAPLVVENDPSRPDARLFGEEYDRRLELEERAFGGDEEEGGGDASEALRRRVW